MNEEENREQLRRIAMRLFGFEGTDILKESAQENELDYEETIFDALKEIVFHMGFSSDGSEILTSDVGEISSLIMSFDYVEIFEDFFQIEDESLR